MSAQKAAIGWRIYGATIVVLALVGFALGDFLPGQPAPSWLPARPFFAAAASGFMLLAGIALQWRRIAAGAAAALTAYYAVLVVVLMDGRVILGHLGVFGAYSGAAEQLAIAAAGLIVYAAHERRHVAMNARLTRIGQIVFGLCALLFGAAHFVYMELTTPLVPQWLPPSPAFWAVATGVFHILGGLAILTGVRARLAAILLTVMYAAFTPLVHLPMLLSTPGNHEVWSENALNLALMAVAWVVADSLRGRASKGSAPQTSNSA